MPARKDGGYGVLLDIDGVLYVGDDPIEGAHQAFSELRELSAGVRLLTNTTSRSRRAVHEHLVGMGFDVAVEEVPALQGLLRCRLPGRRELAVIPLDSGVSAPAPAHVGIPHAVVPAFHGGLLGDHTTAQLIDYVLQGRPARGQPPNCQRDRECSDVPGFR